MVEEGKEGREGGRDALMPKGDGDFHCDRGSKGERVSVRRHHHLFLQTEERTDGQTGKKEESRNE